MKKELEITALVENLPNVLEFVVEQLEANDCSMKNQLQIEVAVEELFVNIAHYAYAPDTGTAKIIVETTDTAQTAPAVNITFMDKGMPFDPLAKQDPDVSLSADKRKIGGLGIYMVKKSMDNVSYEYSDGYNILTITKSLS